MARTLITGRRRTGPVGRHRLDNRRMKTVVGYCDPLSLTPGGEVRLMVSSHVVGTCQLELVRVVCGDFSSKGPGFREDPVALPAGALPDRFEGREQALTP